MNNNEEIVMVGRQLLTNMLNNPSSVVRCEEITKAKGLTKEYWWSNNVYAGLSMHALSYEGFERSQKFVGIDPCTKEFFESWKSLSEDEKDAICLNIVQHVYLA